MDIGGYVLASIEEIFSGLRTKEDFDRAAAEFEARKRERKQRMDMNRINMELSKRKLENPNFGISTPTPAALRLANEYLEAKKSGDIERANAIEAFAKTQQKGIGLADDGTYRPLPGIPESLGRMKFGEQAGVEQAKSMYEPRRAGNIVRQKEIAEMESFPKRKELERIEDKKANLTKAENALKSLESKTDTIMSNIQGALDTISPLSTGYGYKAFSGFPNTDARKLEGYLQTIKANLGFDELQIMRDNSPTGGALGQVTELELALLQAVNGALDPLQKDLLEENLKKISELYPRVLQERKASFLKDYGMLLGNNRDDNIKEKRIIKFEDLQ